jgi:hypothetical protein
MEQMSLFVGVRARDGEEESLSHENKIFKIQGSFDDTVSLAISPCRVVGKF